MLELEVTESALMHDFEEIKSMLNNLASLGLAIAIDDFGTGYSSLSYLKLFPVDVLKLISHLFAICSLIRKVWILLEPLQA